MNALMSAAIIFAAVLLAGNSAAADPVAAIARANCAAAATSYLLDWGSHNDFLAVPGSDDRQSAFRSPSDTFGQWVGVRLSAGQVSAITRTSAEVVLQIEFDEECNAFVQLNEEPAGQGAFGSKHLTDDTAQRLLETYERGVFYAWSPHMPLSVSGYEEIVAAASQLGIAMIPVLSDHANESFAASEAVRNGLPEAALARNRSIELRMRDLFVHAPAILVFSGGEFVSPALPGFRQAADYEKLIGRFLD